VDARGGGAVSIRNRPRGEVHDPAMVREQDDLGLLREIGQHRERRGRALIVEMNEDIVEEERQRPSRFDEAFERRDAKREVELIERPVRKRRGFELLLVAQRDEDGLVTVIEADLEAFERSEREHREELARAREDGALIVTPITLEEARHGGRGEA